MIQQCLKCRKSWLNHSIKGERNQVNIKLSKAVQLRTLVTTRFVRVSTDHPRFAECNSIFHFQDYSSLLILSARIAHLVKALDLKTRGCGFDSRAGQPKNN